MKGDGVLKRSNCAVGVNACQIKLISQQVTYYPKKSATHLPQYVETHPIPAPPMIPPTQKAETIKDQMRMPSSSDMQTEGSLPSVTDGEQVWSSMQSLRIFT